MFKSLTGKEEGSLKNGNGKTEYPMWMSGARSPFCLVEQQMQTDSSPQTLRLGQVQLEKSLSCRHEDLRWHLQNPGKKQSSAAPTSDPSTGRAEPGEH